MCIRDRSNDGCVPDPDFSRALTFEELDNVADVLISGTDDRKKMCIRDSYRCTPLWKIVSSI